MNTSTQNPRVLSGMRPTGALHLGHYHGVIKNWVELQHTYECLFFVADWHALTTHYDDTQVIADSVWNMVIDWLACGVSSGSAKLFLQSRIPEHAELHMLLSMITPLGWLERIPSFKDQQATLKEKDLSTYGFLGYPLLQSADILIYKASLVPVGDDQVAHIEFAREVARRFNYIFGREIDFKKKTQAAIEKLGNKNAKLYTQLRKKYQEKGDTQSLDVAHALLKTQKNISIGDLERLYGYLEGEGKIVLPEPQALLTSVPKVPGTDGQKMSKSYANTISLRELPPDVEKKLKKMPTDPARKRRSDPGNPQKCPVWSLHALYSNEEVREWVKTGCKSAGIGCLECKEPLIDSLLQELAPIQERIKEYESDIAAVQNIINEGCDAARDIARDTLDDVRRVMGISYR